MTVTVAGYAVGAGSAERRLSPIAGRARLAVLADILRRTDALLYGRDVAHLLSVVCCVKPNVVDESDTCMTSVSGLMLRGWRR